VIAVNINALKLGAALIIAVACIVALILDADTNQNWAVPVLGMVVGYIVGNAQVTARTGNTAPIISTRADD
jgi:hypothetical protein